MTILRTAGKRHRTKYAALKMAPFPAIRPFAGPGILAVALLFAGLNAGPVHMARAAAPLFPHDDYPSLEEQLPSILVMEIQQALGKLDRYRGPVNGHADAELRLAVIRYQKDFLLPVDGMMNTSLRDHIRNRGTAEKLLGKLSESKERQITAARQALLDQPATRDLILDPHTIPVADPLRDSGTCLNRPTIACLIEEARQGALGISKAEFRHWVLRNVIKAQTFSGLDGQARSTTRELVDPRMIMVSLRDQAAILAEQGRMETARSLALSIPDPLIRAKSLTDLASAQPADKSLLATALQAVTDLKSSLDQVDLASRLSVAAHKKNHRSLARDALALTRRITDRISDPDSRDSAIMMLMNAQGRLSPDTGIPALIRYHRNNRSHHLWAVALADAAIEFSDNGNGALARETLAEAEEITGRMQGASLRFVRGKIAAGYAAMGLTEKAVRIISEIDRRDWQARMFLTLAAWKNSPSSGRGDRWIYLEHAFRILERLDNGYSRLELLSRAAVLAARNGQADQAMNAFKNAADLAKDIENRWWRSRALSKLAITLAKIKRLEGQQ